MKPELRVYVRKDCLINPRPVPAAAPPILAALLPKVIELLGG